MLASSPRKRGTIVIFDLHQNGFPLAGMTSKEESS